MSKRKCIEKEKDLSSEKLFKLKNIGPMHTYLFVSYVCKYHIALKQNVCFRKRFSQWSADAIAIRITLRKVPMREKIFRNPFNEISIRVYSGAFSYFTTVLF